jgi:uncharacterized membrane protein
MLAHWLSLFTLAAALGSGLVAGVFFAFSSFVMKALARLPASQAIGAMQAINLAVINPLFLGAFLGTAAVSAGLAVAAFFRGGNGASDLVAAAILYVCGCFLVTILLHVPLNNALASADPDSASGAVLWARYLKRWVRWNHVRAAAAMAASAAFILAFSKL